MTPQKKEQLNGLLKKLDKSAFSRFSHLTSRGILQILPGGSLYDAWAAGYSDEKELDEALILIVSSLLEAEETAPSVAQLEVIEKSLLHYLSTFERLFLSQLDVSRDLHNSILVLLRELLPPESPSTPMLFLLSGPSASGKDAILHSVLKQLRTRGVTCEPLTKYTSRHPRKGEFESPYYMPYQRHLTKSGEFERVEGTGEIILPYRKYGHRYGFSKSDLEQNGRNRIATFCILTHFQIVFPAVSELRRTGIRVLPILIYAPAHVCRRRMYGRNLTAKEVQTRIDEMESDCGFIDRNPETISTLYSLRIVNDDDRGFNRACNDLYRFAWDSLRTEWISTDILRSLK